MKSRSRQATLNIESHYSATRPGRKIICIFNLTYRNIDDIEDAGLPRNQTMQTNAAGCRKPLKACVDLSGKHPLFSIKQKQQQPVISRLLLFLLLLPFTCVSYRLQTPGRY
jgi:hypothetical protein